MLPSSYNPLLGQSFNVLNFLNINSNVVMLPQEFNRHLKNSIKQSNFISSALAVRSSKQLPVDISHANIFIKLKLSGIMQHQFFKISSEKCAKDRNVWKYYLPPSPWSNSTFVVIFSIVIYSDLAIPHSFPTQKIYSSRQTSQHLFNATLSYFFLPS